MTDFQRGFMSGIRHAEAIARHRFNTQSRDVAACLIATELANIVKAFDAMDGKEAGAGHAGGGRAVKESTQE